MANIKTFARIKPSCNLYKEYKTTSDTVAIKTSDGGSVWNVSQTKTYSQNTFKFSHVFAHDSSQEEVFDTAAKGIVEAFLKGYNGTIFAYGQTGSGKTYTMEGSARQYRDRGLAPRAISMIYHALASEKAADNSIHMSYLEIYQEVGYDLLNPAARHSSTVTPFPKVVVLDCMGGSCLVKNLSSHLAASEAVAQSLLLQGQANRKVAETPMNQRSSRSHAVLTLQLTSKKKGSDIITRSKLHLVDLAGSERVAKMRIEGVQLTEAKYINLSLHHLEGVIVALQHEAGNKGRTIGPWTKNKHYKSYSPYNMQWNKPSTSTFSMSRRPYSGSDIYQTSKHIPYRNSLLTMVLKDSLGGNCMTAMIATLSMECTNLGETLSTCRFAQRVACITNQIRRNEEIDDKALIRQLQRRIGGLEAELSLIRLSQFSASPEESSVVNSKLTDEDKIFCDDLMKDFVTGKVRNPLAQGVSSPHLFFQCLKILRELIVSHVCQNNHRGVPSSECKPERVSIIRPSASADDLKKISQREEVLEKIVSSKRPASSHVGSRRRSAPPNGIPNSDTLGHNPPYETSIKGKYKSPYERKREKEIRKLNEKIENALNQHVTEEKNIKDWKEQIKQEQLDILYKEISYKADVMRDHLTSQHALVLKLKDDGADTDLIEREKLAEKQLKKRQAKIERRLHHIKQKMTEDKPCEERSKERQNEPKRRPKSVEEKFSKLKKPDGSLNTRQVLEKLQLEERRQIVRDSKLQEQRIKTVAEELEVREAATRLKLREFKEKLKQLRETRESKQSFVERDLGIKTFENFSLVPDVTNSNSTDAMKRKMLAEQNLVQKSSEIQNGFSEESQASAFKPYKKGGRIVPKPGFIQLSNQNKSGIIDNSLEVVDLETSAQGQGHLNGAKSQKASDYAFRHESSFTNFRRGNGVEEKGEKSLVLNGGVIVGQKESYPFIRAAISDYECGSSSQTILNGHCSKRDNVQNTHKNVSKPPLPGGKESSKKNGWVDDDSSKSGDHIAFKCTSGNSPDTSRPSTGGAGSSRAQSSRKSATEKWNSGYSSASSRPSTSGGERKIAAASPEKLTSVKRNSMSFSRPSSGTSLEMTLNKGHGSQNWNTSFRTSSPVDSWTGVQAIDTLNPKNLYQTDFAQSYDSGFISMENALQNRSQSFDASCIENGSSNSNEKPKSDKVNSYSDKKDRQRHHSRKKNRKHSGKSAGAPDSKTLPGERVKDSQAELYRPSEVYTNQSFDVKRMGLKDKGFDNELYRMLDGENFKSKEVDSSQRKKTALGFFGAQLKPSYMYTADEDSPVSCRIQALREEEREPRYLEKARQEKERVARIRKVRTAAEVIQRYWRRYHNGKTASNQILAR